MITIVGSRIQTSCLVSLVAALVITSPAAAHGTHAEEVGAATARIAAEPREPRGWLQRAELHRRVGRFEDAERDLDRAQSLDPALPGIALGRAALAIDRHQPAEALRFLEPMFRHEPPADAHLLCARAEAERGRPLAAADALDRALGSLNAPDPDLYLERAGLLEAAGTRHRDRALAGLYDGIARLGPVPALVERAIDLEMAARRFDAALALHTRLRPSSGRDEAWYARQGELLALSGRRRDAAAAFARALERIELLPGRLRAAAATRALEARLERNLLGSTR